MDSQIEEIRASLFGGNYQAAFQCAKKWLEKLPLHNKETPEYKQAQEAYLYSRYFLNRHERIHRSPVGEQRARLFLEFLEGLKKLRTEHGYDRTGDHVFWKTVSGYIHAQIAEGFAKAFAGQKSYNLDDKEIIQLAMSLLTVEKWRQALEALSFLHRYNRYNPEVNLLMSFAYFHLNDEKEFLHHLREAMFFKPELLGEFSEYVPRDLMLKIAQMESSEHSDAYNYRYFALVLEINGFYKTERILSAKELAKIENEFQTQLQQFNKNREFFQDLGPRLLLSLCWLYRAYRLHEDYDKTESYRNIMSEIDPEVWQTYFEKGL